MTGDPFEQTNQIGQRQQKGCLLTFMVWAAAIGWLVWIGRQLGRRDSWEDWVTFGAYVVLIFIAPTLGILQAMDLKPYLDWKNRRTGQSFFYRGLITLGCWLLALVMTVFGVVGLFIGIREMWEANSIKQGLTALGVCGLGGMLTLGGGWLFAMPFRNQTASTEEEDRLRLDQHQHRLTHPHFASIEEAIGFPLPASYKVMFMASSDWMTKEWWLHPNGLEDEEVMYSFTELEPAHVEALRIHPEIDGPFLCFGRGDDGEEELWLQLGAPDPPVWHSNGGSHPPADQIEPVAGSFSEFLRWPKQEA
ncbi:SMI1/KNR4 family protein [Phragmitibacter flavus]|uniref:SMI1/KNR4 family protein n=1 Tax=Phragmitibacter flavus TaxID=2576071 RepID=A0A5R8KKU4_9BACT|nr:SMI1/KNR4 family protein [Phragmitibacter flavus]TLD72249.1 SMI1/KNR4 family protein [Phragmitibacter flavus]